MTAASSAPTFIGKMEKKSLNEWERYVIIYVCVGGMVMVRWGEVGW